MSPNYSSLLVLKMEGKQTGEERKVAEEEERGNKQERRGVPEDSVIGTWEQTRPEADSVPFCRESSALTPGTVSGDTEASGKPYMILRPGP